MSAATGGRWEGQRQQHRDGRHRAEAGQDTDQRSEQRPQEAIQNVLGSAGNGRPRPISRKEIGHDPMSRTGSPRTTMNSSAETDHGDAGNEQACALGSPVSERAQQHEHPGSEQESDALEREREYRHPGGDPEKRRDRKPVERPFAPREGSAAPPSRRAATLPRPATAARNPDPSGPAFRSDRRAKAQP